MTRVVVTGAGGFVGRHVVEALGHRPGVTVGRVLRETGAAERDALLAGADAVIHLAGVNRPDDPAAFAEVNAGVTGAICQVLAAAGRKARVVFASSTQAALDNPYGTSKRSAEELLAAHARDTGADVTVFRLTNVFGKWCRPNYNSVVATVCHGVATGAPYTITDPARILRLVYVDDVAAALVEAALAPPPAGDAGVRFAEVEPVHEVALGDLVARVESFTGLRAGAVRLPDLGDLLTTRLYATWLSYLPPDALDYRLEVRSDPRGSLAEFVKSPSAGQIFVSRTHPGITRGNHYHHTKTEKFLVVEGDAAIRFRHIERDEVIEYRVSGEEYRVLDIPPGYTHSIENVGTGELVTVFWASEEFDPARPDTRMLEVLPS